MHQMNSTRRFTHWPGKRPGCCSCHAGALASLGGVLHDKSASLAAHLVAAVALHLARVQHAPLPLLQRDGRLPFDSLLRHMQV